MLLLPVPDVYFPVPTAKDALTLTHSLPLIPSFCFSLAHLTFSLLTRVRRRKKRREKRERERCARCAGVGLRRSEFTLSRVVKSDAILITIHEDGGEGITELASPCLCLVYNVSVYMFS